MFNFNVIGDGSGATVLVSDGVTYTTMCGTTENDQETVVMVSTRVDNVNVRTSGAVYAEDKIYNVDYSQQ